MVVHRIITPQFADHWKGFVSTILRTTAISLVCWGERIRTSDWLIQNSLGTKGRQTSVLIASDHRVAKHGAAGRSSR